jgi:hypothetical protein
MSDIREPGATAVPDIAQHPARRCAFCDAPYTLAMTAWLGPDRGCACCGGALAGHWPIPATASGQTQDLACEACGKTLYLAPQNA